MASPKATPNLMKILKGLSSREPTTGMADSVNARITETGEPAALSHGEYVIDAQTVAMIGDGNSDAGAKVLDGLVGQVRKMKGIKDGKQPKELGGPTAPPGMPAFKKGGAVPGDLEGVLKKVLGTEDLPSLMAERDNAFKTMQHFKNRQPGDTYGGQLAVEWQEKYEDLERRINKYGKTYGKQPKELGGPTTPPGMPAFKKGGRVEKVDLLNTLKRLIGFEDPMDHVAYIQGGNADEVRDIYMDHRDSAYSSLKGTTPSERSKSYSETTLPLEMSLNRVGAGTPVIRKPEGVRHKALLESMPPEVYDILYPIVEETQERYRKKKKYAEGGRVPSGMQGLLRTLGVIR